MHPVQDVLRAHESARVGAGCTGIHGHRDRRAGEPGPAQPPDPPIAVDTTMGDLRANGRPTRVLRRVPPRFHDSGSRMDAVHELPHGRQLQTKTGVRLSALQAVLREIAQNVRAPGREAHHGLPALRRPAFAIGSLRWQQDAAPGEELVRSTGAAVRRETSWDHNQDNLVAGCLTESRWWTDAECT